MVTARTAEECVKLQSEATYDKYKQHETEEIVGDPFTTYSPEKWEFSFSNLDTLVSEFMIYQCYSSLKFFITKYSQFL